MRYILLILLMTTNSALNAAIQGDSFSYQGELIANGQPANGNYDMIVDLYSVSTNGSLITSVNLSPVVVNNGIFTIQIDFGDMHFIGDERWIAIQVKPQASGSYTLLSPRQLIANSPYSIQAQYVGTDGVDSFAIKNASVTTNKIANGAVTNIKLAANSVNTANIINGTIVATDIDNSSVQQRITGTCPPDSSIRSIAANGTVTCETDDTGSIVPTWGLLGNTGTTPGTHFIGTTDETPLEFKVNNTSGLKIIPTNVSGNTTPNISMGSETNTMNVNVVGAIISGGSSNIIKSGNYSFIAGGENNYIDSDYSFVGGKAGRVRGPNNVPFGIYDHPGTFIWSYTGMESNDVNQFLVEAKGGFGIGTDKPFSPLDINGKGTSFGSITGSTEVVVSITPDDITDNVALVLNRYGTTTESAMIFSNTPLGGNAQIEYDIRTDTGSMDFNHYDASENKTTMLRMIPAVPRMDVQAAIEPWSANTYDLGADNFRWRHVYTENITTRTGIVTDSDKRLKDRIVDLDYGLAEVLTLRPVSYHLKQDESKQTHLGFIAQEVESIVPEIIRQTSDEKHMRSMSYSELIPVLIKATQEQQIIIEKQANELQIQRQEFNELKRLVHSLTKPSKLTGKIYD